MIDPLFSHDTTLTEVETAGEALEGGCQRTIQGRRGTVGNEFSCTRDRESLGIQGLKGNEENSEYIANIY